MSAFRREGLHNLGVCSIPSTFDKEEDILVPSLLLHGTSAFVVSSKGLPNPVALYDNQVVLKTNID